MIENFDLSGCRLFRKVVNPATDIESYLLEQRLATHQQALYFTQKSMTDDGRFLVFNYFEGDDFEKHCAVADLQKETVTPLRKIARKSMQSVYYVDARENLLYRWEEEHLAIYDMASSLADPVKQVPIPLAALRKFGDNVTRLSTHLSLSPDKTQILMDTRVDDRFILGSLDLRDGSFEFWAEAHFPLDHGHFHPTDPDLAMGAWEVTYKDKNGQTHPIHLVDGVYPRIWTFRRNGTMTNVPPQINNYATHEIWAPDGKGIYYCANGDDAYIRNKGIDNPHINIHASGVHYHDLATGKQRTVVSHPAAHADIMQDGKFIVFDCMVGPWFRGCSWSVHFFNCETCVLTDIHTAMPKLNRKDEPNWMHPDPHPHFVCQDRLVVSSCNDAQGRINVSLTPVAPIIPTTEPRIVES